MRLFLVINYNLIKEKDAKYKEVDVSNSFQFYFYFRVSPRELKQTKVTVLRDLQMLQVNVDGPEECLK